MIQKISEAMEKALIEQGIKLISGATYERVEQDGNIKKVTYYCKRQK